MKEFFFYLLGEVKVELYGLVDFLFFRIVVLNGHFWDLVGDHVLIAHDVDVFLFKS